ncbi:hypothetical protein IP68_15045 [Blastomonas sp. AAP25]|nr:hypothetical protein IP68_15045 [Blastomonas sp. AAP25]
MQENSNCAAHPGMPGLSYHAWMWTTATRQQIRRTSGRAITSRRRIKARNCTFKLMSQGGDDCSSLCATTTLARKFEERCHSTAMKRGTKGIADRFGPR